MSKQTHNRLMPDRLDLGSHMASCVGQAMFQQEEWINKGRPKRAGRMVMGYCLPTWQRPFVWSKEQSIKLIESLWLGVNIGTYTFNRSHTQGKYDDLLIDGQQRMKAIENYLNDDFKVFGYLWSELTIVDHRSFDGRHFHCYITQRDDDNYLRNYYNMMNFSGTAHIEEQRA